MVEGVLTLRTPMEDYISPGESMERPGNGGEILDIPAVVPGDSARPRNERTSIAVLEGAYFPDSHQ